MFGLDDVLGLGVGVYGAIAGNQQQKKANQLQQQALDTAKLQYDSRAPLRQQGMQILGQSEAPINMGHLSYNASNPFAAARGPTASNATRFQSQPGFSAQQANDALSPPGQPGPSPMEDMIAHIPGSVRNRDQIIARIRSGVQPLGGSAAPAAGPRIGMQPLGGGL